MVCRGLPGAVLAGLVTVGLAAPAGAQLTCEACHGELELLRQHVPTLDAARALLVTGRSVATSAHGDMRCEACHSGFRRFPHPDRGSTATCASCHEETTASWRAGMHGLTDGAECSDCHSTHDVRPADDLDSAGGATAVREACASCHFEAAIPDFDPHADSVSCAGCHEPHATLPATDPRATVHASNQGATCAACHEEQYRAWQSDAHGTAVLSTETSERLPGSRSPAYAREPEDAPACTACHGAHGMRPLSEPGFASGMIGRCSGCHEAYSESFADSYHGQAARLGSERVAACYDCHGAHGILPASDPASSVAEGNRLATCRTCHESATAGFAGFEPHADHRDPERYPVVYWSYRLMTTLLVGVFTVFGAHTLLWMVRLGVDRVRGGAPRAGAAGG